MRSRRLYETLCQCLLLIAVTGCCCTRPERLVTPAFSKPKNATFFTDWWHQKHRSCEDQIIAFEAARLELPVTEPTFQSAKSLGEDAYALAERLHAESDDRAVDYWARAIAWMDDAITRSPCHHCQANGKTQCILCQNPACRAVSVRHSAMARILSVGQSYGRLDPSSHLLVNGSVQPFSIPVIHEGFIWEPGDFSRLLVFEPPSEAPGNVCGDGVPLVVLTPGPVQGDSRKSLLSKLCANKATPDEMTAVGRYPFVNVGTPFAATALLRIPTSLFTNTEEPCLEQGESENAASLTFINPLTTDSATHSQRIAQSPAMPLKFIQQSSQYSPLTAFLNSDAANESARLRFFEPFQADKTPLLFVHGLISDPLTFIEMANSVRADPVLRNRYQIWAFRYPTGAAFLSSAATLRQELTRAFALRANCDSEQPPSDLFDQTKQAVIVGHSMGGLVAKMQITDSGDRLWRSISNVPLEQLRGPPDGIAKLRSAFFFEANPDIGRVVYIATPHRGSPWASCGIGRLSGLLARKRLSAEQEFRDFVAANPGAFSGELQDSLPSSVELLRPNSDLLETLNSLESSPATAIHSIIGDSCRLPRAGRSDGVVPISSAYVPQAETTVYVDATHTSIQHEAASKKELLRILTNHLMESVPTP